MSFFTTSENYEFRTNRYISRDIANNEFYPPPPPKNPDTGLSFVFYIMQEQYSTCFIES